MSRDDEQRRKAFGDAVYETWRRGGNPDSVSQEQIDHHFYNGPGFSWDEAAQSEVRRVVGAEARDRPKEDQ